MRWNHPELGRLLPDDFIRVAEHTGLVNPLTVVRARARAQPTGRGRRGPDACGIAVNVSPRSLHHAAFPGRIREMLDAHGVPPSSLVLEITENLVMSDPDGSMRCLDELHDMGVRLVIDDFGKGYSSLSYLRRLPVDEIKIDRSFIIGLADGEDDTLVRCIIDLAHNLGMTVIAEGVETEAVLRAARRAQLRRGAGLLPGKPGRPRADWIAAVASCRPCTARGLPERADCASVARESKRDQLRFSGHVVRPPRASLPPSPFLERPGRSLRVDESTHESFDSRRGPLGNRRAFCFWARRHGRRQKAIWISRNSAD